MKRKVKGKTFMYLLYKICIRSPNFIRLIFQMKMVKENRKIELSISVTESCRVGVDGWYTLVKMYK